MWLGMRVPKATQSLYVARRCGLAKRCQRHKACMSQDKMLKGTRCRRLKACMLQGNVPRHKGAEGDTKVACLQGDVARHEGAEGDTKFSCRRAMWLCTRVPKAT
ncbi:hypothetical protein GBA52_018086 [Prunus armeniaca]|nr:hypothetical protein GBA52_018086 [Prunus armeniaca]